MTAAGGHSGWRVELTRAASDVFRSLAPVLRRALAERFESMAGGPPPGAVRDPGDDALYTLSAGPGYEIRFLVREEERVVLVVSIHAASRPPPVALGRTGRWLAAAGERLREVADDVRFGARSLRRAPAFTLGVVLTLAVGLGGTTTIYGLVDTVFRAALPFEDGDRLVRVRLRTSRPDGTSSAFNVTPRDFHLVREGNRVFDGVVAMRGSSVALLGDDGAERASAIGVTEGWAALLGVRPLLGRTFTPDEEALGTEAGVAMISHALWERRFGTDPSVLGTELAYDGGRYVVVGVLRPRFSYPYDADLWTPRRVDASDWTSSDLNVVARLSDGVDVEAAAADADRLYAALKSESPGVAPHAGFEVRSSRDDFIRDHARALQSLSLAVAFLFLLVCVNVASLFTARLLARRRETALRAALGAGRARLFQSAVVESALLFGGGGAVGLLLVGPLGEAVSVLIPDVLRTQLALSSVGLGPRVLAFAAVAAAAAGLLTGAAAAARASRVDLQDTLRDGARGNAGAGGGQRDALVVLELALSLVLLLGAGVLAQHFVRLQGADLGFETDGLFTTQVALQGERYAEGEARSALVRALLDEIGAQPGVTGVGLTSVNPLCCGDWGADVRIEGLERPAEAPPIRIHHRYVTPEYFGTMGIELVRGRNFGPEDRPDAPPAVIIDADLAARFWPGQDPVGRRIGLDREGEPWRTIVGVAEVAFAAGDERETWYLPFHQEPLGRSNEIVHLMVRSPSAPPLDAVRTAASRIDPALALFGGATMHDLRMEYIGQDRMGAVVAGAFALAGLLLAAIGLYGLLAYQVELRARELGTRIALGARAGEVAGVVVGRTVRLFAVGIALGTLVAYGLNQALVRVMDGVRLADPVLLSGLVGVLALAVAAATWLPTRKALRVDPARVLQAE